MRIAMMETRSYELTQEQILEICEALKFQADDLDHREGSRADIKNWTSKAASLWALIDKFQFETSGIRYLPPALPDVAQRKEPPLRPDTSSKKNGQPASSRSIAGKYFLPAAFIFLLTCFSLVDPHVSRRYTILEILFSGVISGLFLVWIGSNICRAFRKCTPKYASYAGIGLYWLFIAYSLYTGSLTAYAIYSGWFGVAGTGLFMTALCWVVAIGAWRALTGRVQTLSSE